MYERVVGKVSLRVGTSERTHSKDVLLDVSENAFVPFAQETRQDRNRTVVRT